MRVSTWYYLALLELAVLIIIALIFNLETANSVYGNIMVCIVFGTLAVAIFKTVHVYREKHPNIVYLNFIGFGCIITIISIWFV